MILHNDPLLSLYFGDAKTSVHREFCAQNCSQEALWDHSSLKPLQTLMHLKNLLFLKQIHSDQGVIISADKISNLMQEKPEGDFLITDIHAIGLGVYTADCLPIVFYDKYSHVVGISHAGWIGSVNDIAIKTLEAMKTHYGTKPEHVKVFFGPSARVCCYTVTEDFKDNVKKFDHSDKIFVQHGYALHFDLPTFNKLRLEYYGIKKDAFHCNYNVCTICHDTFCSYRREGLQAQRQLTVVALK